MKSSQINTDYVLRLMSSLIHVIYFKAYEISFASTKID